MQKKTTISILISIGAILVVMTMLYWTSPLREELAPAGFSRNFSLLTLTPKAVLELDNKNPYIAGIDNKNIYLGDYHMPYLLVKCDRELTQSVKIGLRMHGIDSIKDPARFRTVIDSPYFYMANGVMPIILRGKMGIWIAETFIPYKKYYFASFLPITSSSFAIQSYSTYQNGLQLALLSELDTPHFKFNFNLLKQQQDGLFSVQGYLLPYKNKNKVVYVYSYRNQYLLIDAKLENHRVKHTIDTFSIAPIKVGSYNNNTEYTLSTPPNITNGISCIFKKYLYIHSMLLAENEDKDQFKNASTIDVYDLERGEYSFSFHIPNFEKNELSDFRVSQNKIHAIYNNKIVVFSFPSQIR